jgi:hypothetical protein
VTGHAAGGAGGSPAPPDRDSGVAERVLQVLAAIVTLAVFVTAAHDVSRAWDVWYYHLPFAARLAGILPRDVFVFHAANEARFDGLPLLGEMLQGAVWRVTGRLECANLVAFACVPLFAWFSHRRLGVAPHLTVLGLFAIPLVLAHASSCYVDLLANAATAIVVLLAIEAHATERRVGHRTLALAAVAAAVAANTKVLVQPIVLAGLAALAVRASRPRRVLLPLVAAAVTLAVVFAKPLENLVLHGNPFFPVRASILGLALPGVEDPYSSAPPWLASAPEPVRFVCSLLEIGVRPMTDSWRWTVDQWMPPGSTGPRMGGFFGAYVVLEVAFLVIVAVRQRSRVARMAAGCFAAFTALTAIMPQAHELRYYMAWMIVLVTLNRWLACREGAPLRWRVWLGATSAAALVVVILVSRGVYVLPTGSTFQEVLKADVDPKALAGIADGERVCVRREPWNLLWAAPLHPPRRYVVKEAEDPEDCAGYRPIDASP